jgi:sulfur-oxidizing protein SoxY
MMSINKRSFLKYTATSLTTMYCFWVSKSMAAWPEKLFNTKSSSNTTNLITDNKDIQVSDKINIKAPEIAENGAVVPVSVEIDLPDIKTISILVDNNPSPLTSVFNLTEQCLPFVSTRVKMAETSQVVALAETHQGKFFSAARSIKVTIGGCGG